MSSGYLGSVVLGVFCYSFASVKVSFGDEFGSSIYQHEKSGWFFSTTRYGGSAPFRGSSSSAMGCLVLVASDSLMTRRCDGPQPSSAAGTFSRQDACWLRHAAQDGIKNLLPSLERRSASSGAPRPPPATKTGRCYRDLFVIYESCKGVFGMWVVIFLNYE